ncbi:hypothetical protein BCR33DRAFT_720392 [Rhizoclosmatium globosum]|uniref:G-protein coupled receptors family 2 profile 2 domain-containing protein n=1 Tax=Rhizoclosmatium globosum TaxID=329046 RepID=A0A1Y2BWM3_9FUNG|nr:hypothetical protein BCR33DRAFT_720392 [Rhizoclosmatium globosum]|eukprot:ORY39159.1 hypothetical protein BCR33DRAFT_720392 [Rhizoclosmatium globosum]
MQAWIALSEIPTTITWGIGTIIVQEESLCTAFGAIHEFFLITTASWHLNASLLCWIVVKRGDKGVSKYWRYFHIYAWGTGMLFTLASFIAGAFLQRGNVMGDATFECWFGPLYADLRIWCFYFWIWLQFGLIVATYIVLAFTAFTVERDLQTFQQSSNDTVRLAFSSTPSVVSTNISSDNVSAANILSVKSSTQNLSNVIAVSGTHAKTYKNPTIGDETSVLSRVVVRGTIVGTGFVLFWSIPTALRVMGFMNLKTPFWLTLLAGISLGASGLCNPAVYFVFRKRDER